MIFKIHRYDSRVDISLENGGGSSCKEEIDERTQLRKYLDFVIDKTLDCQYQLYNL